ncbi:polysaccharide deacetylase [Halalkalicoccus paucihalophilus]|uniref:Polysaccharide deacetylase n=1 Tax=Halalkalicoccus paucihalophilus TaxID=1008153 RepID=A0A151AD43_9EURY|nr:polysaccharide deacetylase family protein [Halalkalicoccus paucihalophilus]KYH25578.1 polysaccharide deacetylase [Halalkalicoccus paucihalophilus]
MTQNRRRFLAAVAAIGVAGCTDSTNEQADVNGGDPTESDTDAASEYEVARETTEEPLFDFRDIEEWDAVSGTLAPDESAFVTGDRSARLDGAHAPVLRIERSGLDLDLTKRRFSIVSRLHSTAPSEAFDIVATDADGNDMQFRTRFFKTAEDTEFMPLDLGIHEWDETVDLAAIDTRRIQIRFGEETSGTLWVDSIRLEPIPETPKLMVQWDDGFASQYTKALPIQHEYDIPSTTFINTANLGGDRLTVEQLDDLHDHGWEIGSHLMTHENLRELPQREQESQIRGAKEWLVDNGFEESAAFLAYPYGTYDQSSYDLAEEHHTYAMVGGNPGYGLPRSPAHLGRSSERTLPAARTYVDTLVRWGGTGGLFWHEIPAETPVAEFDAIMSYIGDRCDAGELDVITLSELADLQGR